FFFSSRRRHTRSKRDWSSDVCSSDLVVLCTENTSRSANGVEIVEQHAYTVESVNPDGSLTLVNPWGEGSDYEPDEGAHRITVSQDEFDHLFDGVVIADAPGDWER